MRTVMDPMSRKAVKDRKGETGDTPPRRSLLARLKAALPTLRRPAKSAKPARKAKPVRRSRFAWMKTPLTRRGLSRFWLPMAFFGIAALVALNWNTVRTETLTRAKAVSDAVIEHPEFAILDLVISGHRQLSVNEIGAIVGLPTGRRSISSLRFDPDAAREALMRNRWIETATVGIDPSGTMLIDIVERVPTAIWHGDAGYFLIDAKGVPITPVEGADTRLDLPLLIGEGANEAVADALSLLYAAPASILPEISALVRRGKRRWDLVSRRGLVIKLPQDDPLRALRRYIDLDLGARVQPYAVTGIDLRHPTEPPVIRLAPGMSETRAELLRTLRTTYQ